MIGAAAAGAAVVPPPVGAPIYISGSAATFMELALLLNGAGTQTALAAYNPAWANQRVTVIISFPKSTYATLQGHPGHVGVALWNTTNNRYSSAGIFDDGSFGTENFTRAECRFDNRYELWYFSKNVAAVNAAAMHARMVQLSAVGHGYGMVLANRLRDSYNCVTAADTILWAGGESWGLASSASTPYGYSCTFSSAWTQVRIDQARHN
jgi:hypothetical protein